MPTVTESVYLYEINQNLIQLTAIFRFFLTLFLLFVPAYVAWKFWRPFFQYIKAGFKTWFH